MAVAAHAEDCDIEGTADRGRLLGCSCSRSFRGRRRIVERLKLGGGGGIDQQIVANEFLVGAVAVGSNETLIHQRYDDFGPFDRLAGERLEEGLRR